MTLGCRRPLQRRLRYALEVSLVTQLTAKFETRLAERLGRVQSDLVVHIGSTIAGDHWAVLRRVGDLDTSMASAVWRIGDAGGHDGVLVGRPRAGAQIGGVAGCPMGGCGRGRGRVTSPRWAADATVLGQIGGRAAASNAQGSGRLGFATKARRDLAPLVLHCAGGA